MLLQYYVVRVLCCCVIMLLQCYVIRVLCCYVTMLLQYYVIRVLCCCVIMLSGYYTIAISQQSLFHRRTDYQYITILINQRIQLYYNNLHTIIWYRLICNICKSGCHSSIQHKTFNIEYLNFDKWLNIRHSIHTIFNSAYMFVTNKLIFTFFIRQIRLYFIAINGHGATIHFNPNRSLENRAFILREIRHDYGNN